MAADDHQFNPFGGYYHRHSHRHGHDGHDGHDDHHHLTESAAGGPGTKQRVNKSGRREEREEKYMEGRGVIRPRVNFALGRLLTGATATHSIHQLRMIQAYKVFGSFAYLT